MIFLCTTPSTAQSDSERDWGANQFYGNRVKAGSILLSGAFQRFGFSRFDGGQFAPTDGIGIGVGLGERLALTGCFLMQDVRNTSIFASIPNFKAQAYTYQAGFRYLPKTLGGFIQFYTGLYFYHTLTISEYSNPGPRDSKNINDFYGLHAPFGCTLWVSTFMGVNLEFVNITYTYDPDSDIDEKYHLDMKTTLLDPTVGLIFLVNGKKP